MSNRHMASLILLTATMWDGARRAGPTLSGYPPIPADGSAPPLPPPIVIGLRRFPWRVAAGLRAHGQLTLSWPRLTWPALAWRHAGPWPRKISATSGAGRDIAADGYAGNGSFFFFPDFLRGCDSRSSGLSMRYRSRRGRARRKGLGSDSMTPFRWRRAVHKIPAWSFRGAAKRRARN